MLAAIVSISSKYWIRHSGKHIFNPVNLGLIVAMLTGEAWVSPGQWGNESILLLFMLGAGLLVLLKVGRIDTSIAFLLCYGGLEAIRTVFWLGWPLDHLGHHLLNGTLLLFAFFMITDPRTTPNHIYGRITFAAAIGLLTFILNHLLLLHSASPIWALFLIAPLTPFFDRIWQAKRFEWHISRTPITH